MDFSPVVRGCECYCCLHHTRAYLHHLLLTREILASTLLMVYVQFIYLTFCIYQPSVLFSGIISLTICSSLSVSETLLDHLLNLNITS